MQTVHIASARDPNTALCGKEALNVTTAADAHKQDKGQQAQLCPACKIAGRDAKAARVMFAGTGLGCALPFLLVGACTVWMITSDPSRDSVSEFLERNQDREPSVATDSAPETTRAVGAISALEQMEVAFVGNPRQADIRAILDRALALYNTPISEENYSRAGSALVALRQEFGPSEMDILDYMIRSHVPGANMSFPDMAGISAAALSLGVR